MLSHLNPAKVPAVQAKAATLKADLIAYAAAIAALPAAERDQLKIYLYALYRSGLWSEISHAGITAPPAP